MISEVKQATDIREYYEGTYWDYRVVWTGRQNLACHFGFYDQSTRSHQASLARANEVVAEAAGLTRGGRVLDAGCGLGGTSLWLAENIGASVLGVSLSDRQVSRAQRAARERGIDGSVKFQKADFTSVDAPDSSFDAVIAIESLCHLADKRRFFDEAIRLLRPGGRVVVADFMRTRSDQDDDDRQIMEEWRDGWSMSDLGTPDDHIAAASAAGFAETMASDVTDNVRPSLRRLYLLTYLGLPLSILFRGMSIRNEHGHRNVIASRRQFQALNRNLWRYMHFSATKP